MKQYIKTGKMVEEEGIEYVCDICKKIFDKGAYDCIEINNRGGYLESAEVCLECAPKVLKKIIKHRKELIEKYRDIPF